MTGNRSINTAACKQQEAKSSYLLPVLLPARNPNLVPTSVPTQRVRTLPPAGKCSSTGGEPMAPSAASAGTVRPEEEVNDEVQEFYQDSTVAWEKLWGNHFHHGFYDAGVTAPSPAENRASLVRMVEEALRFAGVSDDPEKTPRRILDVGCGVGGASIYVAKKYGAHCDGINISPIQIERARIHSAAEGLEDKVKFHLVDAMEQPFPDGHFDLVWCMETAEHMTDKEKFFSELVRVAAPGATIVITSLCRRDPDEKPFTPDEVALLKRLAEALHHGSWFTVPGYVKIAESLSLQDIKTADWSENVLPFWPGVMQTAMTLEGSTMLLESGMAVIKSILMAPTTVECFKKKLINYSIITFRKP